MSSGEESPSVLLEALSRTADAIAPAGDTCALIGGFAVAFHGIPRPTRDIDLLFTVPKVALPGFLDRFAEKGFSLDAKKVIRELGCDHLSQILYQGIRIDLLDAVIPLFRKTVERARAQSVRGHTIRVATAEDLIALKLAAGRDDDLRDIRGILRTQRGQLDLNAIRQSIGECCPPARIALFETMAREG